MPESAPICLRCKVRPSLDPRRRRICEPCSEVLREELRPRKRQSTTLRRTSPEVRAWLAASRRDEGMMPGV